MTIRYLSRLSVTGSLCPSSRRLASAVAEVALRTSVEPQDLVFAGIGNGVIAQRFLHWSKAATFVDIERAFCDRFVPMLRSNQHRVVCSDIAEYLNRSPDSTGRLVVSCVPLVGPFFSPAVVEAIVSEVVRGGRVVFYSYMPRIDGTRFARRLIKSNVLVLRERAVIWNFPPAYVYSLRHAPT